MEFSNTAIEIIKTRYSQEGEDIHDVFRRVAKALADVSHDYNEKMASGYIRASDIENSFYNVMMSKQFIPAGRTLRNAGSKHSVVANCVVLGIEDNMESITDTLRKAILLQQQGCGIGFDFSRLRPAGFHTGKSQGTASGPVSFMQVYDNAFGVIKQQGRHGANMGMMSIWHPDIIDFISCKKVEGDFRNFNISILVDDEFMSLLKDNPKDKFISKWNGVNYIPRKPKIVSTPFGDVKEMEDVDITYEELWENIAKYAHKNGEPGIAFIDNVNKNNPLPGLGDIHTSNPCGEQMLHENDNCNLGSINVAAFFKYELPISRNDSFRTKISNIDWIELEKTIYVAIEMLDNTIDLFDHKVEEINDMAKANRRIGLGIMGWADLLQLLEIPYGSGDSFVLAQELMQFINSRAENASIQLAKERGNFPNKHKSIYKEDEYMRNCARTSIAPTGSISMVFDVNSGIEPYFSLAYTKSVRSGNYNYVCPQLLPALRKYAQTWDEQNVNDLIEELCNGTPLIESLPFLVGMHSDEQDKFLEVFKTSDEIPWAKHIGMMSVFQEHTDNSISKTINLANDATVEDIVQAYEVAYDHGLKSITVYRDGSRDVQVLNKAKEEVKEPVVQKLVEVETIPVGCNGINVRPKTVYGFTERVRTAKGNMYVVVNYWERNGEYIPQEVFAILGKEGGEIYSQMSANTRMVSFSLRAGVNVEDIVGQLKGISSDPFWDEGVRNEGPIDALAQVLENSINKYVLQEGEVVEEEVELDVSTNVMNLKVVDKEICPKCYTYNVVRQEGCKRCLNCDWSAC